MPSKSPKQARFFAAIAHDPAFAKRVGVSQSVGKDFNNADAGTGILNHPHRAEGGPVEEDWSARLERNRPGLDTGLRSDVEDLFPGTMDRAGSWEYQRRKDYRANPPFGGRELASGGIGGPGIGANLNNGHEGGIGFATGGMSRKMPGDNAIHDQPFGGGYLDYAGAGRTDQLPLAVATDSHVLPADSLSGAGQDHSLAGARIMALATGVGPMGIALPHFPKGHGPPAPPHAATSNNDIATHLADGGQGEKTSILAAGGEMILPPWYVQYVGEWGQQRGEAKSGESVMDTGHRLIDRAIMRIRKFHIDFLKTAPKPKK